jgi:hypothetical protein
MFLAFDPAVSRHHEVFFFPTVKLLREEDDDDKWSRAKAPCWTETEWQCTSLPNLFEEEEPSESEEEQQHESHSQEEPADSSCQSNPNLISPRGTGEGIPRAGFLFTDIPVGEPGV